MIEIQPFVSLHAGGVVAVILPIQQSEFSIPISLEAQPDLLDIAGFYQRGNGNFWVALDSLAEPEPTVVGTAALLDIGNDQVALRKMFVAADYRGSVHGVSRKLLTTLVDWCRTRAVRDIFLGTTAKFLAAHRFYEKNDFHEIARENLPPAFPIMPVDTKFYCRHLVAETRGLNAADSALHFTSGRR